MRPDTPAENVDHTAEAARLERTAGQYPEDAEALLLRAAAHLELSGDRPAAAALYDRLLASDTGQAGLENPYLVRALKASNLWEYGHEAEARAIIDGIRAATPRDPAPWAIVAESLEAHDELEQAHETFTEAVRLLLTDVPEPPVTTHPLLFGRHRVRRMLGAAHDEWDALADTVHPLPVTLDELHDPKRVWSLGSENPAELEAEISRLRAELGAYRTALSRPFPVAVLHWPAQELTELLEAYPSLAGEYPSPGEHPATIETALRELAASGTLNLGIVAGTVPSYEAFAASEGASPDDADLLPQYATTLAARGRALPWPPQRSAPCWCGSGRAYGECHGAAAV
ncbi:MULTISPECIES: SEC-C domain-containing protein [unclassified Streptomyces]|uniref:SEC-C domain-containing protein n=1 Tax=unclassified Streptomyces TaxID=2593676 RepID=UPI0007EC96F7|nr:MULTISPECIES: SEC-C domain-containing protein [unclassified Streptomyces]MCP3765188.1 SEC-C domain-containing protein [Streptomyces sp. MAR25Y5]OBQ49906.1 preprotein translocase subunit SecA [Streptomyces sp. H-KF8]